MKSIPSQVTGYIIIGLALLGWGLMRLFNAVQAGFKQGFGPKATLVIMGKLGYHTISLKEKCVLLLCLLLLAPCLSVLEFGLCIAAELGCETALQGAIIHQQRHETELSR